MKVSTDSVLLGAMADVVNARKILDVGTGTGIIALMLAQRSLAQIDAVEISKDAFLDAQVNVDASPWKNRIFLYHNSFQEYARNFSHEKEKYDLIISNPPYYSNSLLPPDKHGRAIARHDFALSDMDLLGGADRVLKQEGSLWLIKPLGKLDRFLESVKKNQFFVNSERMIRYKPGRGIARLILQLSRIETELQTAEMIIENEEGGYSEEFIELTKDFYL